MIIIIKYINRIRNSIILHKMKIFLHNFRCWKDASFEFGKNGLVLLNGPSGIGKSSILNAIYFCLYGLGTKIVTNGEKHCSVSIKIENEEEEVEVKRTKGPNRLVVVIYKSKFNEEYEDDDAQEYIYSIFGKKFNTTSYITQKMVHSFISMSPSEKLKFLEEISINHEEVDSLKKRVKDSIKNVKESVTSVKSKCELLNSDPKIKPDAVVFPLGKFSEIKVKNNETRIKNLKKKYNTLLLEREDTKLAVRDEEEKERLKNRITLEIDSCISERDSLPKVDYDGDENLLELKNLLLSIRNNKKLVSEKEKYNESKKEYDTILQNYLNSTEEKKSILQSKLSDIEKDDRDKQKIEKTIKTIEKNINLIEKIESLQKNIIDKNYSSLIKEEELKNEELKTEEDDINSRINILTCPCCKNSLVYTNGELSQSSLLSVNREESNKRLSEIKSLKSTILKKITDFRREEEYQKNIKNRIIEYKSSIQNDSLDTLDLKILQTNLITLKKQYDECIKNTMKIQEINKDLQSLQKIPSHISSLKTNLLQKESLIKELEKKCTDDIDTDYTEYELEEEISKQTVYKQKFIEREKRYKQLVEKIKKLENEHSQIKYSDTDYKNKLVNVEEKISECLKNRDVEDDVYKKITDYKKYIEQLDVYNSWYNKLQEYKKEEEDSIRSLSLYEKLYKKISEAESLSLLQTIDRINYYSNFYLEKFFTDNPISIQLLSYKETKKDIKPLINIEVYYKDMIVGVDTLSGGEYDRVSLSIVLALNTIFGGPILMLDESISSLDADLTSEIIEVLKENLSDKLTIIVSHQISSGMFDRVIDL